MTERSGVITFKGNPMTLIGGEVKAGDALPTFKVVGQDLGDISNQDFANKVLVLSVVPSVDTPVCAAQTRKFNEQAAGLSSDVTILTVSMDLPFAAKRFCAAEGIEAVKTGSDYKYAEFGPAFGVKIKELGLLTRAVFVAGRDGKVKYVEYVPEVTSEPNYDAVLSATRNCVG